MDDLPLQITTSKNRLKRKVEVDGYTYMVRLPGAGESLTFRQLGREMTRLESLPKMSKEQEAVYEEMTAKSNEISLELFDALGNKEAKTYIDSLDIQTLLEVIGQIFGKAEVDGNTDPTPDIS